MKEPKLMLPSNFEFDLEDKNPYKPPTTREAIGEPEYEYKPHPYLSEILWFGLFSFLIGLTTGIGLTVFLI